MTLVHDVAVAGAATHAIVIGCGAYAHLPGGSAVAQIADPDGMAQLSSPPASAREISDWLVTTCNSSKPLASVSLLLSETAPTPYRNPTTQVEYAVELANATNVEQAIREWADRGDEDADNRTIFYFCGHGISAGVTTSLLLSDFGGDPWNIFKGALNFDELDRGMERIKASEQLFLVDACRVATGRLLVGASFVGVVPLAATHRDASLGVRKSATLFSTLLGAKAHGLPNSPSVFTSALLTGLSGAGSQEAEDDATKWRVDTSLLKRSIDLILKRRAEAAIGTIPPQTPSNQRLMTFPIHDVVGSPLVPVFVRCRTQTDNSLAEFACTQNGNTIATRPSGNDTDWEFVVESGDYKFSAVLPTSGATDTFDRIVRPAFGHVELAPT